MTGFAIETLAAHDRAGFDCGIDPLNRYLRQQATQDIRRRLSNCFIAVEQGGRVAGYYTLAAASLPMTDIDPGQSRRLPRYPSVPAGLIGRLAVAIGVRGQRLGAALVVDAIGRVARAEPAIFALIVDAKDESAAAFYLHLGFCRFVSRPFSLYLPVAPAIERLPCPFPE